MVRTRAVVVSALLLVLLATIALTGDPLRAASNPTNALLNISAPKHVKVGHPIQIRLTARGAAGVGGYETNLLFDTQAAKFASFSHRGSDLDAAGRDIGELGPVESSYGVALGAFSCPVKDCVNPSKGAKVERGSYGAARLADVTIIPNRPGKLEIRLDGTKLVDTAGKSLSIDSSNTTLSVQVVGRSGTNSPHAAPVADLSRPKSGPSLRPGPLDLTKDEKVSHADAMEVAVAWTLSREDESACSGDAGNASRDINRDGCIDVADVQTITANYGAAVGGPRDSSSDAQSAGGRVPTGSEEVLPRLALAGLSGLLEWIAPRPALAQDASTFAVNSEGDAADANAGNGICATAQGQCTLRAAIEEANLRPGSDTITFKIPGGGVRTIQLGSKLPTISDETGPTIIDGYTQAGSSPNNDPRISNAAIMVQLTSPVNHEREGMIVTSPGNVIRGLALFKFQRPIWFYGDGADNNTLIGSFVGTNAAGTYHAGSVLSSPKFPADGVTMQNGAQNNNIGRSSAADRNVISGNAYRGVVTLGEFSDSERIVNNIVGLSPSGTRQLANLRHGIDINAGSSQNQIGGTLAGERNVVSGNAEEGVEISHEPSTIENRVVGNFVGTDATGNAAPDYASNGQWGVHVEDRVRNNLIADNVIGNSRTRGGIRTGTNVVGTVIENNRIGVSLNGTPMPSATSGVQIDTDSSGMRVGPNNVIGHNGLDGVRIVGANSDRNTVTRNSIFANQRFGIDIDPLGQSNQNDPNDADSGPNEQLNFPVFGTSTALEATGSACSNCTVEVFLADGGANGYGQGKTLVGSSVASSDGAFAVALNGVENGDYISATATDGAGNTSEFSPNRAISADTTAPGAPTNLTATTPSPKNVTLDWADNTGAGLAGYSVYRSTTSGGPYTKITSSLLSSSSYTDKEVIGGTTYHYVVTATHTSSNESGFSKQASVTPFDVALSSDGIDDTVSIPNSTLLNATGAGQRTYELRIKTGQDVSRRQFVYEEGGGGNGFSVEIQGGRIYFNAWSLDAGWDTVSASGPVNANTTYHIAGVYHSLFKEVSLYLNGGLQGTSVGAGMMKSHPDAVALGGISGSTRDYARTTVNSGSYFSGLIDDFRAWNYARSQAQIQATMNSDLSGNESGLITLYRVDEGSGAVLNDSTPNALHGTIRGASWVTIRTP